jgi:hypothetical protein
MLNFKDYIVGFIFLGTLALFIAQRLKMRSDRKKKIQIRKEKKKQNRKNRKKGKN